MSIKVHDSEEAIRFIEYFITKTCENIFDKMFKDLEMHEKERHYERDCNETSFMWSVYGGKNHRRIITLTVDDTWDKRIIVEPVFFYDPGMFSRRKPICFNIQFDEKDRRFKFEIFAGKWGPKLDKSELDPFNDPYELVRFDELMDLYKQLKTVVGQFNINLEFVERVEVEDEAAEESDEETPYTEDK